MQFCSVSPYLKTLRGALWGKLENNQQSVLLSWLSTGSAAFLCAGILHACEKHYANAAWWVFKVISQPLPVLNRRVVGYQADSEQDKHTGGKL